MSGLLSSLGVHIAPQAGRNLVLELMNDGVKFRSDGVFTKHVLRQVARRMRVKSQELKK